MCAPVCIRNGEIKGEILMSVTRRNFLKLLGAGVALASTPVIEALAASDLPDTLRFTANAETRDPIHHVLSRTSFGVKPGQVNAVRTIGLQKYLEQQLNPDQIDDSATEKLLGDYITLDMTVKEMLAAGKEPREVIIDLKSATVLRAITSERQLHEVMVNFWSEHFSIYHRKQGCQYLKTVDDRDVIRKHALGNFRDLLYASAHSPAMLVYLDNAVSNRRHPNENYARELMELHTITVGNYTETDVKEVARCFTGWSVQRLRRDPEPGIFMYRPMLHDPREKTVLGRNIGANGGKKDGEMVLDLLAAHYGTALHIASKLCRRFISDNPPNAVVKAAAQTFMDTQGDIKSILRTIFASQEFLNAPPKFKRPFEYYVSLARAFDAQVNSPLTPINLRILDAMGHLPFDYVTPDGYSDYASGWISNMLLRWNLAIAVVYNQIRGVKVDLRKIAQSQGIEQTATNGIQFFAQHLLGRPMTQAESDALMKFASRFGEPTLNNRRGERNVIDTIALIAASPAFQYR